MTRNEAIEQALLALQRAKLSAYGISAQKWIDAGEALAMPKDDGEPLAYLKIGTHSRELAFDVQNYRSRGFIPLYSHPPKAVNAEPLLWVDAEHIGLGCATLRAVTKEFRSEFPTYTQPLYTHPPTKNTAERVALVERIDGFLKCPWFDPNCEEAKAFRDIRAYLTEEAL